MVITTLETHANTLLSENFEDEIKDYKTKIQELIQKHKHPLPIYTVIKKEGPDHEIKFHVQIQVQFEDQKKTATGKGSNKKEAEQNAAKKIYTKLSKLLEQK